MKKIVIDLSELPPDLIQEYASVLIGLRGNGLYRDGLLYTVVDGARLGNVLHNGTYREGNRIFARTQFEMDFFRDPRTTNRFMDEMGRYEEPATVIWNGSLFIPKAGSEYAFKEPDNKLAAIEGVAEFKMR